MAALIVIIISIGSIYPISKFIINKGKSKWIAYPSGFAGGFVLLIVLSIPLASMDETKKAEELGFPDKDTYQASKKIDKTFNYEQYQQHLVQERKKAQQQKNAEIEAAKVLVLNNNALYCEDIKDMYKASLLAQHGDYALQMKMPRSCGYAPDYIKLRSKTDTIYPNIVEVRLLSSGIAGYTENSSVTKMLSDADKKRFGIQ